MPTPKIRLARNPASLPKSDGAGVCFWTHSASRRLTNGCSRQPLCCGRATRAPFDAAAAEP